MDTDTIAIWKEMNEVLSHFQSNVRKEITTSSGRKYIVSMESQKEDGSWEKIDYFVRTSGKCKLCQNFFSGQWAVVWNNGNFVNVPDHLLHRSLSHPTILSETDHTEVSNEVYKKVFLH